MRNTQQFSIALTNEMAQMVKTEGSSGEYASESEVIRDGLRALLARDKALESWLRTEGVDAYDKLKSDPARALSVDRVREHLASRRKRPASA